MISSLKASSLKLCVCVCGYACMCRESSEEASDEIRVSIPPWTTSCMKSGHLCAVLTSLFPVQVGIPSIHDGWMPG